MNQEELRRLGGWAPPFRAAPGESLDAAWRRCRDARWMLAVAIEAGVRPRGVTRAIVACLRALFPELWDEPPWRGALYVAEAYGRGEMDADALRQLLPPPPPAGDAGDWYDAAERARAARAELPGTLSLGAARAALDALHPDTDPHARAKAAALLVDTLASIAGFVARESARDAGEKMLESHRREGGGGIPVMLLPAIASGAWDEAAQRAYAHALRVCADRVREVIASLSGR